MGSNTAAPQARHALLSLPSTVPSCSWHSKWPLSHCSSWFLLFLLGINRPLPLHFIPITASAPASCHAVCLCQSLGTMAETVFFFSRIGRCLLFDKVNLSLGQQMFWKENNPHPHCASSMKGRHFHLVVPIYSGQFGVLMLGGKGKYNREKQHRQVQTTQLPLPVPSPHLWALHCCLPSARSQPRMGCMPHFPLVFVCLFFCLICSPPFLMIPSPCPTAVKTPF